MSSVLFLSVYSFSLLQPPSSRACKIIAFDASTSAAMNGNLIAPKSFIQLHKNKYLEDLLVSLVVVVRVAWSLHGILNQLLKSGPLAYKLDELGDATAAAEHNKFVLLEQ